MQPHGLGGRAELSSLPQGMVRAVVRALHSESKCGNAVIISLREARMNTGLCVLRCEDVR